MSPPDPDWIDFGVSRHEGSADAKSVAAGSAAFAASLYAQLAEGDRNLLFSPASVAGMLAMAYAGARGDTASEIATALALPDLPADRIHAAFAELASMANQAPGVELTVANALFGQLGGPWSPEFLAQLADTYAAPLRELDFVSDPGHAAAAINHWVTQETRGMIDAIVPPGAFNSLTRLVLANAICFKGKWLFPFERRETRDAPFYRLDGRASPVSLMHQKIEGRVLQEPDLMVLELKYELSPISMLVILPRERDGWHGVEASLPTRLTQWLSPTARQSSSEVIVELPRFEMRSPFLLASALHRLGIARAFDRAHADFSGMNGGASELSIGTVAHEAVIDVDEEGTTAAAATWGDMETMAAMSSEPPEPIIFRADHPFLFVIRDSRTNNILFLGRVMDPRG